MSGDGSVIVGQGRTDRGTPQAFLITVPEPSSAVSLTVGLAVGGWCVFRSRKPRRSSATGMVLLFAFCPTVTSAQNLIRNGSFESPFASSGIISVTPSSVPPGFEWSVDGGSVEVTRQNYIGGTLGDRPFLGPALDGSQWLDLDGEEVKGGPGSISQAFDTSSGSEYTLNFSYSSNPYRNYSGGALATVSVVDAISQVSLFSPFQQSN